MHTFVPVLMHVNSYEGHSLAITNWLIYENTILQWYTFTVEHNDHFADEHKGK